MAHQSNRAKGHNIGRPCCIHVSCMGHPCVLHVRASTVQHYCSRHHVGHRQGDTDPAAGGAQSVRQGLMKEAENQSPQLPRKAVGLREEGCKHP